MSTKQNIKSSGRNYSAAEKLAAIEHEIVIRKRAAKRRATTGQAATQLDVLRSIARDYRAPAPKTSAIRKRRLTFLRPTGRD